MNEKTEQTEVTTITGFPDVPDNAWYTPFMFALLAFVVLDYITGIMCAVVDRKLNSRVGFRGIFRKILIFALVGVGHLLDTHIIGTGSVLRTAVIFFYLSNEGVSLVENAAYLGLPIPAKLKLVLEQLHDRAEKEKE